MGALATLHNTPPKGGIFVGFPNYWQGGFKKLFASQGNDPPTVLLRALVCTNQLRKILSVKPKPSIVYSAVAACLKTSSGTWLGSQDVGTVFLQH